MLAINENIITLAGAIARKDFLLISHITHPRTRAHAWTSIEMLEKPQICRSPGSKQQCQEKGSIDLTMNLFEGSS